jgi:C1A family cysteine protease
MNYPCGHPANFDCCGRQIEECLVCGKTFAFAQATPTKRMYGWRPSLPKLGCPTARTLTAQEVAKLPLSWDMESKMPVIYDQGALGSCTANAAGALAEYLLKRWNKPDFMPCRLAIYYWERVLENTVNEDSGASIADSIQVMVTNGVPHETLWTYSIPTFRNPPSAAVRADGLLHKVSGQVSLPQDLNHMKAALASNWPVLFGFTVYQSFESNAVATTGIVPMPKPGERVLGGHAVMLVGYDDAKQMFKVRNSWGTGWGQRGYFWMPYQYVVSPNLAADFWTAKYIK